MVSDALIMFLWIFSAVGVGCRVTLLYYCLTPGCKTSFFHYSLPALISCFSFSVAPSLPVPFFFILCLLSFCVFSILLPRWLPLKWPWDWPEWFLRSDSKNVWEMRRRTKGSCRGPFQHAAHLCYLGQELCRRTGAIRRIGQRKEINSLWNWCGSRKFRKRCKGKQHCIMYLLTFPCIVQLAKDDKMKCFGVPFCYWSPPPHLSISHELPSLVCSSFFFLLYLFVGDKFLCLMRRTQVFFRKMRCSPLKDADKYGPYSCLSNYRPGTEECQSERQMVQGWYLSLTSSFSASVLFPLKPDPAIFHKMTAVS